MKKNYDVISKKKALHENQIRKIHAMSSKSALKFGIEYGELRRGKKT